MDILKDSPPFEAIMMIAGTTIDEIIQESVEKIKIFEKYMVDNHIFCTEDYIKIILENYLNYLCYFKVQSVDIAEKVGLKTGE